LFEQFDSDVQTQIELLLGQGKATLQEGCDLLERRYRASAKHSALIDSDLQPVFPVSSSLSTATTIIRSSRPALTDRNSSTSVWTLLRWSLRDKERVESILRSYQLQNNRVHDKIKLWCLASDLGVNVQHLQRLQSDDNSKRIGFDTDASLKLTQALQDTSVDLELKGSPWTDRVCSSPPSQFNSTFTTIQVEGRWLLRETFLFILNPMITPLTMMANLPYDTHLDERTKTKVKSLARLLHQPKEQIFRIPHCYGWCYSPQSSTISYFFEAVVQNSIGNGWNNLKPLSLSDLLRRSDLRPELGFKYALACKLATSIAQLHMVQWLHESFRSDNIVFLEQEDPAGRLDCSRLEPLVLGFEFSRQESDFSDGLPDYLPARDIYRHPQRQGRPERRFSKIHDIYSLGVVLLEIGLWEPALSLEKNNFINAGSGSKIREQLVKQAERRLDGKVGKRYKAIVVKCLSSDFGVTGDTREDLNLQQAFRAQVIDVLERAAASV
jgi:hypothetical protein